MANRTYTFDSTTIYTQARLVAVTGSLTSDNSDEVTAGDMFGTSIVSGVAVFEESATAFGLGYLAIPATGIPSGDYKLQCSVTGSSWVDITGYSKEAVVGDDIAALFTVSGSVDGMIATLDENGQIESSGIEIVDSGTLPDSDTKVPVASVVKDYVDSLVTVASQSEAVAGTDNTAMMTPLRTANYVNALLGSLGSLSRVVISFTASSGSKLISEDEIQDALGLENVDENAISHYLHLSAYDTTAGESVGVSIVNLTITKQLSGAVAHLNTIKFDGITSGHTYDLVIDCVVFNAKVSGITNHTI